jgi:hypothetical protein
MLVGLHLFLFHVEDFSEWGIGVPGTTLAGGIYIAVSQPVYVLSDLVNKSIAIT